MVGSMIAVYNVIVAILVALFFFILSLIIDKNLFLNPYGVIVVIGVVLGLFIYFIKKAVDEVETEVSGQDDILRKIDERFGLIDERFKIYDRLNRLEVKVFNEKTKSAR